MLVFINRTKLLFKKCSKDKFKNRGEKDGENFSKKKNCITGIVKRTIRLRNE
jgi:hypothetical protein